MAGNLSLRAVKSEDKPFLLNLYATTRSDLAALDWGEAELAAFLAMQFDLQSRSYAMQFPDAVHSVVLCDQETAGRLIVGRCDTWIQLIDIAVLPEFRGRGIATGIIRQLQDEATGLNVPLALMVERMNSNAFQLYRKLGFEVTDEDQVYLSMRWTPQQKAQ